MNAWAVTITIGGSLQGPAVRTKPLPAGKTPAPAQPPPKPASPKTATPTSKPPVSATTAAKPKEQSHVPAATPPGGNPR